MIKNYESAITKLQYLQNKYLKETDDGLLEGHALAIIREFGDENMLKQFSKSVNETKFMPYRMPKINIAIDVAITSFTAKIAKENNSTYNPTILPVPPINRFSALLSLVKTNFTIITTLVGAVIFLMTISYKYGENVVEGRFDKEKTEMSIKIPQLEKEIERLKLINEDYEYLKPQVHSMDTKIKGLEGYINTLENENRDYKKRLKIK